MANSSSCTNTYEFENVDHETYYRNQQIAINILSEISKCYEIPIAHIRYRDVISFFFEHFNIKLLIFESNDPIVFGDCPDPKLELLTFNSQLSLHMVNARANEMKFVNHQFSDKVDGLTVNGHKKHVMFINYSAFFPRVIFTILHELSHIYLSEKSDNYLKLVAKINESKQYGSPYPQEMRPIETGANIIASELFANKLALEEAINSNYTFDDMRSIFGMSKGALHNRLLNYFEHSQLFDYSLAKDCTFQIRNHGQNGINSVKGLILIANGGSIHNQYAENGIFNNTHF